MPGLCWWVSWSKHDSAMNVHVREATLQDYDAFSSVMAQADRHHALGMPTVFQVASSPARPRPFCQELLTAEDKTLLAAVVDDGLLVSLAWNSVRHPRFRSSSRASSATFRIWRWTSWSVGEA